MSTTEAVVIPKEGMIKYFEELNLFSDDLTRKKYTKKELEIFNQILEDKLIKTKEDIQSFRSTISREDDNGTNDTDASYVKHDDSSEDQDREVLSIRIAHLAKFEKELVDAKKRVTLFTYGVCQKTKKLIPWRRLVAAPVSKTVIAAK